MYYHDPFGADPGLPNSPVTETKLGGIWQDAVFWTPVWLKEAATITIGVFGALTLFRIFQRKLPKPQ